jgi:hypothetical protein
VDFSPECLLALTRFVEGFHVLAEASVEMEPPFEHMEALLRVLGTPSVESLLDSWKCAHHSLLSRHPSLAQCCDRVFARVGAALAELLRMSVRVLHTQLPADFVSIPFRAFTLVAGHSEVPLVSAGRSTAAPVLRQPHFTAGDNEGNDWLTLRLQSTTALDSIKGAFRVKWKEALSDIREGFGRGGFV